MYIVSYMSYNSDDCHPYEEQHLFNDKLAAEVRFAGEIDCFKKEHQDYTFDEEMERRGFYQAIFNGYGDMVTIQLREAAIED